MKHLLSLLATLLFTINISNAQIVKNEIRTIGGKKYMIYHIKAGETWASIAEKSGITERSLIDANEQANGSLKSVATLKVPLKKSTKNNLNKENKSQKLLDSTITVKVATNAVKIYGKELRTEIKGNKTFTIYKTGKGDRINMLAKYFNTTASIIQKQNKLVKNKLLPGKILKILRENTLALNTVLKDTVISKIEKNVPQEKTIETKNVIKKSDNKTEINKTTATKSKASKKYNWIDTLNKPTVLDENKEINPLDFTRNMNANEIYSKAGNTKTGFTHSVLAGETIEMIARRYKISISDIANWNNLNQQKITVGQELIVSFNNTKKPNLSTKSLSTQPNKQVNNSNLSGSFKLIEEKGLCFISEDKFIGIAHRNAPVGTLLLLTSSENFKNIYVRVTSILVNSNEDVIIQVDNKTAKELAFNSSLTNVLLSYTASE